MASPKRRIETDVMKLLMSDFDVKLINNSMQEFYVKFKGPQNTPFQGGVWKIHVELPDHYPYKSPSIGFENKIFHPNIDEASGSVCLDVINQTWSPMFDVYNIFEQFLPQLLSYPNPSDPLNSNAAYLLNHNKEAYESKIREYVKLYAHNTEFKGEKDEDSEEEAELSDVSDLSDNDDDVEEEEEDDDKEMADN